MASAQLLTGESLTAATAGICYDDPDQRYCNNYTEILEANGTDIIKGVFLFEGYGTVGDQVLGRHICHAKHSWYRRCGMGL